MISLYGTENAGCRYLYSSLSRAGYPAHLVFFKEWRNNDIVPPSEKEIRLLISHLKSISPDLIGIGLVSTLFPIARDLTIRIKDELGIPVLWGGIHPTGFPVECLEYADYICRGEGEETLPELLHCLEKGESLSGIAGLGYKEGGDKKVNPVRPLFQDLDSLPLPYLGDDNKVLIDNERLTEGEPIKPGAEYRIYVSRGCPFSCAYCYNSILRRMYKGLGKYYRFRSVENVLNELEEAVRLFPRLRFIKIDDDTSFCYGDEWLSEFCEKYPARVGLPFGCLIHPKFLSRDLLEKLKAVGLERIQVGLESGSRREIEDDYHRKDTHVKIKEFSEFNRDLKIEVVYDVIIDNPTASEEDRINQVEYLIELERPFKVFLYSLNYLPGTELTEKLLAEGVITPDEVEGKSTKSWRQFRVDFSYPRSAEDRFYLALLVLSSHPWIPKSLLRKWLKSRYLRKHPWPLWILMISSNTARMGFVALQMLLRGELTIFKLRQYARFSRMISQ